MDFINIFIDFFNMHYIFHGSQKIIAYFFLLKCLLLLLMMLKLFIFKFFKNIFVNFRKIMRFICFFFVFIDLIFHFYQSIEVSILLVVIILFFVCCVFVYIIEDQVRSDYWLFINKNIWNCWLVYAHIVYSMIIIFIYIWMVSNYNAWDIASVSTSISIFLCIYIGIIWLLCFQLLKLFTKYIITLKIIIKWMQLFRTPSNKMPNG